MSKHNKEMKQSLEKGKKLIRVMKTDNMKNRLWQLFEWEMMWKPNDWWWCRIICGHDPNDVSHSTEADRIQMNSVIRFEGRGDVS